MFFLQNSLLCSAKTYPLRKNFKRKYALDSEDKIEFENNNMECSSEDENFEPHKETNSASDEEESKSGIF